MKAKLLSTFCVAGLALVSTSHAATTNFSTSFSASQSLFSGGASAGFNESGSTGGSTGISYSAVANSGTVNGNVNGQIAATYNDMISTPNTATNISLKFNGSASSVSTQLGANANVSGFLSFCAIPNIFTGGCVTRVSENFNLLDEGLFLTPSTNFTANLGASSSANVADSAIGFGPNIDLIIGDLGAVVNLDIDQTIGFTPQAIDGILSYRNRNTGDMFATSFLMGITDMIDITTVDLGPGIWDFSLLDIDLDSLFRNDVNLELRPTINYVLGEWPPAGSSPISLGLVDESFALDFNTLMARDLFSIKVVPIPAAVWLFGSGLLGLIGIARRKKA